MNKTVYVLALLAIGLTALAYHRSPALAWKGATTGWNMLLLVAPSLLLGFLLGGMVTVLLPQGLVARYAGDQSGMGGVVLSALIGTVTPAGPFITFPLVAALWKAGAGVAQLGAFLTAWSLLGMHRILVYELPMLGWRFFTVRLASAFLLPIIVGSLMGWLYRLFYNGSPPH